ncbi:MAG: hypothetical protein V2J62_00200 [candidate division KSB1 bacterium]|jgi:hypothetical protein|nr:hypothetical protein [candidate division KSB1 bacterium]
MVQIVKYVIALACFLHLPMSARTQVSVDGYYKNFSVVLSPPGVDGFSGSILNNPDMGWVNNRLRLDLFYGINDRLSVNVAYDVSPRIQDRALFEQDVFLTGIDPFHYRFDDLDSRLYPKSESDIGTFAVFQNLDRVVLTFRTDFADIYAGRQAIAWGSARVINPTDVIAPFTFEELDTEDRIGVDAIRMRIPIGFMGEIDLGYVAGKNFEFEQSALYMRTRFYVESTDVSLICAGFRGNILAGVDLARSIGGAGAWLESALVFNDAYGEGEFDSDSHFFRTTMGMDYSFSGSTYGFVEYHFSSAGTSEPEDYLQVFDTNAVAEGAVYLVGRHYLIPGLTYQITPLLTLTGQTLLNVGDGSIFFAPRLEYNIAENVYVSGGAFISSGERPEFTIAPGRTPALSFSTEFGAYPDIYFTSFRIYF